MISYSVFNGTMPFGKGVFTSFLVSLFILLFGLTSVLSAQSTPRGASDGAVINAETWEALGAGVTGEVFALAQMGNYLYVGGNLTEAGGLLVNNIARYDLVGSGGWEALGQGVNNTVTSLIVDNGVLYVGGAFTEVNGLASTYFAMYDGTTWTKPTAQPVLDGFPGMVTSMVIMDGYVYVGGDFDTIGELSTKTIARYSISGGTWEAVTPSASFFTGFGCTVPAMATDGTSIYVSVPCAAEIGGQSYSGLFSYTPGSTTWAPVGEGLDELSAPLSLLVNDGFLYAAGYGMYVGDYNFMTSGDPDIVFFGRYDLSTPSIGWASLGNPLDDAATDVVIADGSAYVIGQFTSIDAQSSQGMAVLNLETLTWSSIGALNFSSNGGGAINNVIELIGNKLVAGGVIENAGGVEVSNVARYSKTFTGGSSGDGGSGGGDGGGSTPVTFALTAPSNGATGVSVEPLFTWNAPEGVTVDNYMIEIHTTSDLSGIPEFPFGSITSNSYQWGSNFADPILFGNTTYYWIVKGYDNSDALVAQSAETFSFTTASLVLSTPTLVAPADNASDVSLTPTFTWSKDALAESYVLEYSTGATLSGTPTQVNLALGDLTDADPNYSYTLPQGSELESNTQYTWRVIAQKAGEDDMPSAEESFTTLDLSPGAFNWNYEQLEFIVNRNSNEYVTSWTQSDGATSYELNFKIGDQSFNVLGDPVVVNAPATSYVIDNTKFVDGFTYTAELTAVNEYGRTSADPLTIIYTPTKPVATSPKDGAAVDATTSFTWESTENFGIIPGSVLVQILYSNDENADPVANSEDGIQLEFLGTTDVEESKTLTELFATQNDVDVTQFLEANEGNILYWRVSNKSLRIDDADAETQREVVWSDLASFSVPATPQAFDLSTPTNNTTVETFLPTFTWEQSQNATSYKLQIATHISFDNPVYESPLIGRGDDENTVSFTLPEGEELDFLTQHFWRVIASNGEVDLISGHFTFETHFGRSIEILSPEDGLTYETVSQAGTAQYSWPHIFSDANEYNYSAQFYIDEARVLGDGADVISEGNVIGPNPINTLRSGFTYNWYADGYASYSGARTTPTITSESRSFTIEAEKPTVTAPVAQALLASNTMFSWSAEETIYLMDGGRIEGDFDIQLLTINDPNADPQTNPEDGYYFTVRGLSLELNESITLGGLVSLNENVTLDDILSREGETLYFRVRINPEYTFLTKDRVTLWSDLIPVRVPAMPRAFDLLTPTDELSEVSNTPTFTWEQSQFADTYELNVSLNEDLTAPVFTSASLSRGDDPGEVSFILPTEKRLLFGETYYWQVTAIGTGGQIKSGIREFSTLSEGIVLTSPQEGKVFASAQELNDETFMWESYSNAEDFSDVTVVFNLFFKDQSSEYSRLDYLTTRGITSRSISSTNFGHGFTYLWQIDNSYYNGSTSVGTLSERRTFSLSPEKPLLTGPIDGATFTSTTPFEWTTEERFYAGGIGDTYFGGEFHVQILFDESTDVEQLTSEQGYQFLVDGTAALTESFTLEQLFATLEGDEAPTVDDLLSRVGETLYWRVKIDPEYPELEQGREVLWSDVESFTIPNPPSAFNLVSPSNTANDISALPTFTWNQSQYADTYILKVSLNENLSSPVHTSPSIERGNSELVSYTLPSQSSLLFGETYYWQVEALGDGGKVNSEIRSFTTESEVIELLTPEDEKVFASIDELTEQIFDWTIKSNASYRNSVLNMYDRVVPDGQNPATTANHILYYPIGVVQNLKVDRSLFVHGYTYYWSVEASFDDAASTKSGFRSFSVTPEKPILVAPVVDDVVNSGTQFRWTTEERFITLDKTYPGKFIVQILFDQSTNVEVLTSDQGFQFELNGTSNLTESFTLEQLFSGLSEDDSRTTADILSRAGETLYWRVKINPTYDKIENHHAPAPLDRETIWSDTRAFQVVDLKPVLNTPVETDNTLFSWSGDPTARYIIEIDESKDNLDVGESEFSTIAYGNSITISGLNSGTTYFWRVGLILGSQEKPIYVMSDIGEYTTLVAPDVVSVVSPAHNQRNISVRDLTFSWEPDPSATKYNVLVYKVSRLNPNPTLIIDTFLDANSDGIQSFTIDEETVLEYNSEYQWHVIGYNGTKVGAENRLSSFYTKSSPPSLQLPSANASNVSITPQFSWSNVQGAASYDLEVFGVFLLSNDEGGESSETVVYQVQETGLTTNTYTVSNELPLEYNYEYFWRVRARNGDEVGDWTEPQTFVTELAPTVETSDRFIDLAGLEFNGRIKTIQGWDNKLIVGGEFDRVNNQETGHLVVVDPATKTFSKFDDRFTFSDDVYDVLVVGEQTPDIYVSGKFESINDGSTNLPYAYVVRLEWRDGQFTPLKLFDPIPSGGHTSNMELYKGQLIFDSPEPSPKGFYTYSIAYQGPTYGTLEFKEYTFRGLNLRSEPNSSNNSTSREEFTGIESFTVINDALFITGSGYIPGQNTKVARLGLVTSLSLEPSPNWVRVLNQWAENKHVPLRVSGYAKDDQTAILAHSQFVLEISTSSGATNNNLGLFYDRYSFGGIGPRTVDGPPHLYAFKQIYNFDGKMYIFGNFRHISGRFGDNTNVSANHAAIYDPETSTWTGMNSFVGADQIVNNAGTIHNGRLYLGYGEETKTRIGYFGSAVAPVRRPIAINSESITTISTDQACAILRRFNISICDTEKQIAGKQADNMSEISANEAVIPLIWESVTSDDVLSPVTHYAVEFRKVGVEAWTIFARPQTTDTLAVITGLEPSTTYEIRIAAVNANGRSEFSEPFTSESMDLQILLNQLIDYVSTSTSIESEEAPTEFALFQNYPNPFNPTTTIRFALPEPSEVQLEVYSILGQRIAVLSTGLKPAGYHSLQLDASRWASGTYIYRLRAGDRVFTKKLLLLK